MISSIDLDLIDKMKDCEQAPGLSVWEHCLSVWNHTLDLTDVLFASITEEITEQNNWILPKWFFVYNEQIYNALASTTVIDLYTRYHDISKPFV